MARLKKSPSVIRRAILEVDDEALAADDLAALARLLPTADEVCQPDHRFVWY